jgi:riboflavin kinase/FMN adenylyltransferase
MEIVRQSVDISASARGGVVTIGNFDGVHLGHRAVVGEARRIADGMAAPLAAVTFDPHPRRYFQPDSPAFELTPPAGKARQMARLGVDALRLVVFDESIAKAPPESFVEDILVAGLAARHVVVGYDFVFGRGRKGNADILAELGTRHGFGVTSVDPVRIEDGPVYSSTNIRASLSDGDPVAAARLLGRCWEIEGPVISGDQRGRTIGFPTANLALDGYLEPAIGVYAIWAGLEDAGGTAWHAGVANIGRRPTFGGEDVVIEAHLFDFTDNLYDRPLRVALVDYIRPEKAFAGIDELKAQIAADCISARGLLDSIPPDDVRAVA